MRDIFQQKQQEEKQKKKLNVYDGLPSKSDLIAPDGVVDKEDHLKVGSRYVRCYVFTEYPTEIFVSWLETMYELGEDIDVSYHIYPVPNRDAVNQLDNIATQAMTRLGFIENRLRDFRSQTEVEERAADAKAHRDAIQRGEDRLYYVSVLVTVGAKTLEELDKKCLVLEEVLGGRGAHIRRPLKRQTEAFKSVMPMGNNYLPDIYRNFNLGGAVSLFPFLNAELFHEDGVLLGVNQYTGAPVFYDPFLGPPTLINHNIAIFGESGAGKSTAIKLLVARSALNLTKSAIVDPEGEYRETVEHLGGETIKLKNDQLSGINPFDIAEEEGKLNLRGKTLDIIKLISTMIEGVGSKLESQEVAAVEHAIMEEYRERGITEDPESLYEPYQEPDMLGYKRKEMPTLSSLHGRLKNYKEAERTHTLLRSFLKDGVMGIFDCQTEVDLSSPVAVCFDVSELEEKFLRPLAMQVVLQWIFEQFAKSDLQKKLVICDEAWMLLKYKETADFLENISRRGRKLVTGLVTATHSFHEFNNSPKGMAVQENSATTLIMQQNPKDINTIQDQLNLPEGQMEVIKSLQTGEALLYMGSEAAVVRFVVAPYEEHFVETGITKARKENE